MLDIQLRNLLEQSRASGVPDLADVPTAAAREIYSAILAAGDLPRADVETSERIIEWPGGTLALRIHRPRGSVAARAGVLYLHGGGFTVGRPSDYDGVCSTLAQESGCVLVLPQYRLAPEHPFPAAVDDAWAALQWLARRGGDIGVDTDRLLVAGDSAGANLATVLALLARDHGGPSLLRQTLVYPVVTGAPGQFPSYQAFGEGYTLTNRLIERWSGGYLTNEADRSDWRAAPLLAQDLSRLPPTLLLLAGLDPLHDEGLEYARRLAEAGSAVSLVDYPGLAHGFVSMGGALATARLAVSQLASAWRLASVATSAQEQ